MNTLLNRYMTSAATFSPPDAPGASPSGGSAPVSPGSEASPSAPGASTPAEGGGETVDNESGGDDLFAGFSGDSHEEIEIQELGSDPGPDEVVPPVAAPAAVDPPAPAAQVPPVAVAPAAAPAPADQNVSATDESDPVSIRKGMEANAEALQQWMAENAFKLSKEDLDALDLDAGAMIPKLLARGHFEATRNTLNLINNLVPQMVAKALATTTAKTTKASEAMTAFYAAHPTLNDKEHGAAVQKWATAYRATNPKATREEAIKFVGLAVMQELGIAAAPPAPGSRRPVPFAPARAGTRAPISQEPEGAFDGLGMDFDQS